MKSPGFPYPPPNLPLLLPDETLYSWCGHVHLWNGNSSVLETSRQLFGMPYTALLHDFPAFLNTFDQKTEGLLKPPLEIALEHTLLGYFLTFQKEELANTIIQAVCESSFPQMKFKLGIAASRVGGDHPLKLCRQCLSEDLEAHGRGYWHLGHQLPSSFVCIKHSRPLDFIQLDISPVHQRKWLLPETVTKAQAIATPNDKQLEQLKKLAAFSIKASQLPPGSLDSQILAWAYQSRIKAFGMLTSSGSIKIGQFNTLVKEHYAGLEALPGLQILEALQNSSGGFVGSIARKRPRRGHPLKHLLLITMLFDTWEDFVASYKSFEQRPPAWLNPPEIIQKPEDPRLSVFLDLVKSEGLTVTSAAKAAGISVITGTQWAKRHSIEYRRTIHKLHPEMVSKIHKKLKAGTLKKTIVSTTGVSLVTINRLIASDPQLKESWQAARFRIEQGKHRKAFIRVTLANPNLPVKYIRKIPGNGYGWLYRHDRQWLSEHLPSLWYPSDK